MVNKKGLLRKSYLRKSVNQVVLLVILIILASLLLNTFMSISFDYSKNFDRTREAQNSEDITSIYYNLLEIDQLDNLKQTLDDIDIISSYEIDKAAVGNGYIEFGDGEIDNIISVISYENAINNKIGKYEFIDKVDKDGVILSYLFKVAGKYNVGDKITFRLNGNEYTYNIIGFYNSASTGTINCPDIVLILTENEFNDVYSKNTPSMRLKINVNNDTPEDDLGHITNIIEEKNPYLMNLYGNITDTLKDNRYSNAKLFETILSASAIIMVIVLLIVMFISLSNYIRNSTRDLGTLKALGYTSNLLIAPIVSELTFLSIISSIVGSGLSYFVLMVASAALETQIGIPYAVHFLPLPSIITVLILAVSTYVTAFLSVAKIKTIAPINAIRENKSTTSKSSKIITLDKTNINVNTLIGLKGFFSGVSRNVIILIAITCVSFLAGLACFLYQNVIIDNSAIIELVCGQTASTTLTVQKENEELLLEELANNNDVESYYLYSMESVSPKDKPQFTLYIIDSPSSVNADKVVIKGTLPSNDQEIAINGKYAKDNNIEIGDYITIGEDKNKVTLKTVGTTQCAYHTGRDGIVLRSAYEITETLHFPSYYVNLKDGVDIDEFNKEISNKIPIKNYINQVKYFKSSAGIYSTILNVLAIVICFISISIIVFVLYILIYILLRDKRKEHGILKSIGYTSKEIINQTILTITPSCFIAIIIGLAASRSGVKDILSAALQSIGIFRFGTPTDLKYLLIAGLFLILFTLFYTYYLSRSIRKISPHDLFNNE